MTTAARSEFARLFVAFFNQPAKPLPSLWPDLDRLADLMAGAVTPVCNKEH